ncbi:N-acetylglucosamine-6-phosphate deacetylase [Sphingomonas sp.]|uniref:N-acetylglucosamine-6-phosphate deacetylase n=1 Tax=Sphingomonas sp. TaxID=28214 RepID=UPI003B3B4C13
MALALVNGRLMLPAGVREDLCVIVEEGRISALSDDVPAGAERIDLEGKLLLAGFIDTQVNGGGGALFNDDPSVQTIRVIGAAHRRFGTTGFLPTLISDDLAVVARAIEAVDQAIEDGVPGVLGIHIEGPFLSLARHGIHDPEKIRRFDAEAIELLSSARHGRTLVTLAPEEVDPAAIQALVSRGVVVAAGHTNADYETIVRAVDHGLSGFTHIFNAMSPLMNRAPGVVGAALDDDRTIAGIIVDGHHLHPAAVRIALRAKGAERLMLVTDAMPSVGTDRTEFILQGRRIHEEDGLLRDDQGVLAGSALDMAGAVRNIMAQTGVSLRDATAMASAVPARFIGVDDATGKIAIGLRADLILVDGDLNVVRSWIGGRELSAA